ncbi:glycoside hydrolase family 16 protein [Bradyrhizobium sp. 159]|uniref:glycoside hydrolase family 16 protein n=1 Tax=Bradyrhizobium sp. 159 TaxID=2782632 RepID=UPI001FFAF370|nr:glycoside hydrolase family 16 protein [Bradyrhizobium sp. 159]MCK1616086.1 glycoside hydrolase family 16 protein [Bradyrhizobium sp. 159]
MIAVVRRQVLCVASIVVALGCATPAWCAGWELVFSDEFNGDKLDRTKWATRYIYNNETMDRFNDEKQRYRDNHVVSEGALSLTAKKNEGADTFDSAMIRSHQTFYYGYYEARVFLPNARGSWPAFWLEADYDIDGKFWHPPEIDIFEYVINGVEDKPNMLHSNAMSKEKWTPQSYTYVDSSFVLRFQDMVSKEDLNKDWHIAGLVWAPDRISFFWDGRLIYTRTYQWTRKDGQLGPPAHIDLNFAVGGAAWAGRHGVDDAAFPQTFKIDYVRVCQFTSSERGSRKCGPSDVTPDPNEFGYTAALNDMLKPAFLGAETASVAGQSGSGSLSLSSTDQLRFEIPLNIPENYPANRLLQVSVVDGATGAVVSTTSSKLEVNTMTRRADGVRVVEVSMPAIQRSGDYVLVGKLVAETIGENGAKEVLASPVTCSTHVSQPVKARSCRLALLRVRPH